MKILNSSHRSLWHFSTLVFFLIDLCVLYLCVFTAFSISPSVASLASLSVAGSPLYIQLIFLPICMALGLQVSDVQRLQARLRRTETLVRIIFGILVGMFLFTLLHALIHFRVVGRYIILISLCLGILGTFLTRLILWRLASQRAHRVLFLGTAEAAQDLMGTLHRANLPIFIHARFEQGQFYRYELSTSTLDERLDPAPTPVLNPTQSTSSPLKGLSECIRQLKIESLVLSDPEGLSQEEKRDLTFLISQGVRVRTINHFFENELERVHIPSLNENWLWDHEPTTNSPYYSLFKRLIDVVLSLVAIACFLPFFPLLALFIWIDDRGPILYSQERIGLHGIPFRIYKMRTMRIDAESQGAQWAQKNDQRVTRLGRFLRKSRIDEFPQFYNILRGEMSLIGPRPEREVLAQQIEHDLPHFRFRVLTKPGLSGWAQINYGYGANLEETTIKLSYDLYYIKHASIALDLLIVLRTFSAMMRGAR